MKKLDELKQDNYDVIVIGSGVGGLCSACLLAKQGNRVLVLEKHYKAGGFTHMFKRKGYEWDTGVHYIGNVHEEDHQFRKLFDYLSGGRIQWKKMNHEYDRFIFPDEEYSLYSGGPNSYADSLKSKFSNHKDMSSIDEYIELVTKVSNSSENFCLDRALPDLISKFTMGRIAKEAKKYTRQTTHEALKKITPNEKLLGVLTGQYGNYGLPPKQSSFFVHAIVNHHYMNGGCYPVGGGSSISNEIIKEIEDHGGAVVINSGVEEILIKNKIAYGVKLESGREFTAKRIISNAGVHNTFQKLVKTDISSELKEDINKTRFSTGYFSINLGLKTTREYKNTNLWFYPSYNHDENVAKYFEDQKADIPLCYVSFASAKDPYWESKYQGKQTIDILGVSSYKWFKKWENAKPRQREEEYLELKERFAKPYLEKLFAYIPEVERDLDYFEISTPLTVKHYCQYQRGETYGLEPSPERFDKEWLGPRTHIKNLYLTGQDVLFAGVCGALTGGAISTAAVAPVKSIMQLKKIGFLN